VHGLAYNGDVARFSRRPGQGASDNGFIRSRVLRLALAIDPSLDERSAQRSVRGMGPSVPEENRAYGVFLGSRHERGFVDGMGIRFRSGEETRSHHDAVGAQAECWENGERSSRRTVCRLGCADV
jgi:hypothetical protein